MATWVLLRGLMRESRHWGDFPQLLQNSLAGQVIVTLDFPGNGSLHEEASLSSVALMADYCHAQMAKSGYAPPYRVLALSLGAMAALAWSRRHPTEVEKLVLINTSIAPYSPFYHRLRPKNYASLILFLLAGSASRREKLILRLTSAKDRSGLWAQWIRYAQEYPITQANILRQLFAAMSYRDDPTPPSVPVLLLAAEKDELVNVLCSQLLAEQWDCNICLHASAGHDLPLDDPFWVVQKINEWLPR
jgi:pimeloyl-ACP methyl ester carboxylesterase